jgi:hypothetical protein
MSVDLAIDEAEGTWEDMVRELLEGPMDPSRVLTDCLGGGGCGCACMCRPACMSNCSCTNCC